MASSVLQIIIIIFVKVFISEAVRPAPHRFSPPCAVTTDESLWYRGNLQFGNAGHQANRVRRMVTNDAADGDGCILYSAAVLIAR